MNNDLQNKTEIYDLCIVGAGISGLNALFAATKYLNKNSKVLLVDKAEKAGGMWNRCYDNVRLHQPYEFFSVGDHKWDLKKDRSYLATKTEIIEYLNNSLEKLSKLVSLDIKFGYALISNSEKKEGDKYMAISTFEKEGKQITIKSKTLIKSIGLNIQPHTPIVTTSKNINSVSQEDFPNRIEEIKKSKKPVYIIGGGKAGTDGALHLINTCKNNSINILAGRGTIFLNRDILYPKGLKRYFGGTMVTDLFTKIAYKFNGNNTEQTIQLLDEYQSLKLGTTVNSCLLGVISSKEIKTIKEGADTIINDHLVDVIDEGNQVVLILKSGKKITIEQGSWIVNCKEYIVNSTDPYEPYLSDKGTTVTSNKSSSIGVLTYNSSFFLTHLYYLKKLKDVPLFSINFDENKIEFKESLFPISVQHTMHNMYVLADALPLSVLASWKGNFDLWYPIHRRIISMIKSSINSKKIIAHTEKSLMIACEKYGYDCRKQVFDEV